MSAHTPGYNVISWHQQAPLLNCHISCCVACRYEYGEAEVTLELVGSMDEAIDHLHAHGSGHTECIVTGTSHLQHVSHFAT